ncbi:MAG: TolC family protein, partial [Desulfuromonadales bacterium]|nr:TolC family protein [Desulfuromonadales bacterium]
VLAAAGAAGAQEVDAARERVAGPAGREVTLEEALALARRNAPLLEQRASQLDASRYGELTAWGQFLPDLNLSYQYNNSSSGRLDPTGQTITRTSYSAQVGARLDLFQGFRRLSDLRGARRGVAASHARLRESQFLTSEAVKVAYYNAVANRELVRVEADRVKRQEDQLEFARQQMELGRATRSDVLRSQVDLNNAKVALLNAENAARTARFALAEEVGVREPLAPAAQTQLVAGPLGLTREELTAMALRGAPSLVALQAQAQADEAAVASAKAAYLPSMSFNGGWAWSNAEFPPRNRSWSVSLAGALPLFDGFNREAQLFRARATLDQSRSAERAEELRLRTQVDDALGTIEAALASIELAEQSVELADEDLRVSQERYRLGLATILDLQTAQIALLEAEVDLIRRRFDYQ